MSAAQRRERLRQLREAQASGTKVAVDVGQVDDFYEEVDDNEYKKIVRKRMDEDDFVVDDNGAGYADDGREEWDREVPYDEESEDEALDGRRRGKVNKKKVAEDQLKKDVNNRQISDFFSKGTVSRPKTKITKTKVDDDFLNDILGELDVPQITSSPRHKKRERSLSPVRRKVRMQSPPSLMDVDENPVKRTKFDDRAAPSSPALPPHADDDDDEYGGLSVPDELDMAMSDMVAPSSPAAKVALRKQIKKEDSDGEDDDLLEVAHAGTIQTKSVNMGGSRPAPKPKPTPKPVMKPIMRPVKQEAPKLYSSSPIKAATTDMDASSWTNLTSKLSVAAAPASSVTAGKAPPEDVLESDGSLKFFWIDFTELHGSLHLFGKVFNHKTKQFISCYFKLSNMLRTLYFLPRKTRYINGVDTEEELGHVDVHSEIEKILSRMGVREFKAKLSKRKYAFELEEIPRETDYFKVLYPYTDKQLDPSLKGETFSHVFGSNTAMFEQFVLLKNIMGPCWLRIADADCASLKNGSHAKFEVLAEHIDQVTVLSDREAPPDPPLTMMSLAFRTVFNAKENKQEILALSARVYEGVSLSNTLPADRLPSHTFTMIRPMADQPLPIGFEALVKGRANGTIRICRQEHEILSFFLARLEITDPDVIVGHQLEGVDFSILLNRIREKKTPNWSRIGRLRRAQWPAAINKTGGNVFAERSLLTGRLLCDLANDYGKSVMMKCQSWSLTEMCSLYIPGDSAKRMDMDNDEALNGWAMRDKTGLMNYLSHVEADTYFIAALAIEKQLMPLSKVLTNLAGNSWARTLTGTRAERNEYILLHEFHKKKYICPDKQVFSGPGANKLDDESKESEGAGKKKDKYKGGLVFEPEKGLYDRFVLVMDFNSLYPSIIQEYNICFTTVNRFEVTDEEDGVPEVPKNVDQGVLPRLLSTLVQRRREVRKNMKAKDATPEDIANWDNKQLALKLTANSMYGCLGYTKSRFYARPLAMLTTHLGREILRSTKALAEENQLQVIYGDTDSVMINANVDTVQEAVKVGDVFKKAVNERYRLLEIDRDNIFRRILLQAKKKYAAVNLVEQDGKWVEKMEVKGLDMKRREFCALSKEVSQRVLNDILSGDDNEVSIARIHEYLRTVAAKMRANELPLQKFTIYTQLGKAPKDYPNGDTMPQVQVALRDVERGKLVRRLDVISYIITGDQSTSLTPAKRAYSLADALKPDSGLLPDVEWYLGKQIFPPVERLCANIQGTSTSELADALGLDIKKYVQTTSGRTGPDFEIHPLESQIPDSQRFATCTPLTLQCRRCKTATPYPGLSTSEGLTLTTTNGFTCPSCSTPLATFSLIAQLERQIRCATATYYEGWLVCSDPQCGLRTRQMSVYGTRCLGPRGLAKDCRGVMKYEISEKEIYTQLVYFSQLFDVEKAKKLAVEGTDESLTSVQREQIAAVVEYNRVRFGTVKGVVDKYLEKCGRGWVAMDSIFVRLGLLKPETK